MPALLFDGGDNLVDADAEVVVEDQDFAAGDELVVDVDVDRIAGQFVELDDGAFGQFEHVLNEHLGAAEFNFHIEIDVFEQFDGSGGDVAQGLAEIGQGEVAGGGGGGCCGGVKTAGYVLG